MPYYNKDCKKLILRELKDMVYLDYGQCATVSYDKSMIFKKYFSDTPSSFRLSIKVFDILKDIDNPHFIKLLDAYMKMNSRKLYMYKNEEIPFTIDAYTARYYIDEQINILLEPIDYVLDNFQGLEALFKIFSDNKIVTNDFKRGNTILNRSGIVMIDPDLFEYTIDPKYNLTVQNKRRLLIYFLNLCLDAAKQENLPIDVRKKILSFHIEITEKTEVVNEISKKLGKVKKPIDYFLK